MKIEELMLTRQEVIDVLNKCHREVFKTQRDVDQELSKETIAKIQRKAQDKPILFVPVGITVYKTRLGITIPGEVEVIEDE